MADPNPHTPPRRVLMLAHAYQAPYRVMRCAAALGARVYVFAGPGAKALSLSRYCAGLRDFSFDPPPLPEAAIARIEAFAETYGIDMILPADAIATRFLAGIRDRLSTPVFPIPDVNTFDALATKDRFMAFCREHGVRHPEGHMFANRAALLAAVENDAIRLPAILKPIDRWGSVGVVKIDAGNARDTITSLDYAPVLAQDFIDGIDRSISVFCMNGAVQKQVTYCYPDGAFTFASEPELARIVRGIARDLKLDGVFNFDARIEADGTVWLLECNPRFFFTMDAAMIAGANFARIETAPETGVITVPDGALRQPQALLRHLAKFGLPCWRDLRMLAHWLKDPKFFAFQILGRRSGDRWIAPALAPQR
ncbi:MAG: ATP-grasp domain-containing protein [Rhizomicrobium sp.]